MDKNKLKTEINKIASQSHEQDFFSGVDLDFIVPKENLRRFAEILYDNYFMLNFITAVHTSPESVVVYQFMYPSESFRVRGRVFTGTESSVKTVSDIFSGAHWYEREVMEFFGIDFEDNPDKRTLILADFDKDLHPLLKKGGKLKSAEDTGLKEEASKPGEEE
jgi:NADH:ubiquinone oxidoreductase subunit C